MLPEPCFSFTIPSIYDDTPLDCRIYNPPHSVLSSTETTWSSRGAIVAHPYPPLGGCYDDAVVLSAVAEILKQGFVVGTFNFRGAGASKGRTSWQAKPELEDYISFAGFFVHYVESLRAPQYLSQSVMTPDSKLSPIPSAYQTPLEIIDAQSHGMTLILGGYSYGSLITTRLPATDAILQRFVTVSKGTAEAEIRLRAASLSQQWNKDAELHQEAHEARKSRSQEKLRISARAMAVAVGGDESEPGIRHASHEGRRSIDAIRRSIDRSRRKLGLRQHSSEVYECSVAEESLTAVKLPLPQTHYLLISPLLPPISNLATMFSNLRSGRMPSCEDSLLLNPTLAIYGDDDFFTSQKKLRKWAESLKTKPGSQFQFHEVAGAGHFWREEGSDNQMRSCIKCWAQEISRNNVPKQ